MSQTPNLRLKMDICRALSSLVKPKNGDWQPMEIEDFYMEIKHTERMPGLDRFGLCYSLIPIRYVYGFSCDVGSGYKWGMEELFSNPRMENACS
jgi:hypothetical protein